MTAPDGWRTNPDHPEWADVPDWYDGPLGPSHDFIDVPRARTWMTEDPEAHEAWIGWLKRVTKDAQLVSVSRHGETMSVEFYDEPYRVVGPYDLGSDGYDDLGRFATHFVHVNCSEVEQAPCWPRSHD